MSNIITRPTTLGLALAMATIKVDHTTINPPDDTGAPRDNWVARRVALNMDNTKLGVRQERSFNAHLRLKTARKLGFTE